jgi:hypothetical protein
MASDGPRQATGASGERRDALTRRDFLRVARRWSKVVVIGALAGSALSVSDQADAGRRGGGRWANRRGGARAGGRWANRRGGYARTTRRAGWLNRRVSGWVNRRRAPWYNVRVPWYNVQVPWYNVVTPWYNTYGGWVNRHGTWVNYG